MHLDHVAMHLERRAQQCGLRVVLGTPVSDISVAAAEARLHLAFPAQVRRFYQHYNGLRVEDPPLEVLPIEQFAFAATQRLHFATVNHIHQLCFDTSRLNEARQWDILAYPSELQVTLTMASFWSNKLWAWIDKGRPIWQPEPIPPSLES